MLMPKDQRGACRWDGRCPDCGGCIDDRCPGCHRRWCGGTYAWMQWGAEVPEDRACDRCPAKVGKVVTDSRGDERLIMVRCNGKTGHTLNHHWNPWLVGVSTDSLTLEGLLS